MHQLEGYITQLQGCGLFPYVLKTECTVCAKMLSSSFQNRPKCMHLYERQFFIYFFLSNIRTMMCRFYTEVGVIFRKYSIICIAYRKRKCL